jgi:hypothetical protein
VTGTLPPDLTVALEALESDAARWADAAVRLRAASAAAAALVLDAGAFSFAGREAADAYEALRLRTTTLLAQGADELDSIAAALRTSAATYAAEEAAGAHRLGALEGPR